MGHRYSLDDRIYGGSMAPRLNPRIAQTGLNLKIGGDMPRPMVHCNEKRVPDQQGVRRSLIGLPERFRK